MEDGNSNRITQEYDSKIVIFSQWTTMLDLIGISIERKAIAFKQLFPNKINPYDCFERLDGTMNNNQRASTLRHFNNKANCKILLVSLKAG